ncbi:ZIP family metal transporter [Rubellimicrobium aerolatum]|uniref:ZIP family metal transporter n=1 Tax=Rubellimicrobium aerolatum TaxID=490979 RepID=A0ABW0S950_9RHOB|nr:ZIP family zinc transporter [Rubellimicrobium aerolatum]MBP1804819.1 ZIP family zinc transporter [Rubellimicrobium aerolatum]
MAIWVQAGLWGLLGGAALVVGAALAYLVDLPRRVTASVMAFGCGVLVSAVTYDLILEGFETSSLGPIVLGALVGSVAYTVANWLVSQGVLSHAGRHRKRSGGQQVAASAGGGLAIAVGSLLDGVPESVVLGVGLLDGGGVSLAVLAAIVLSNLPEGLSSAVGMRKAGRSAAYVFGLWGGIAAASGLAAAAGAGLMGGASPGVLAFVSALAAGALLTMVADTMIPEAVEGEPGLAGLFVVLGLLGAFGLSRGFGG